MGVFQQLLSARQIQTAPNLDLYYLVGPKPHKKAVLPQLFLLISNVTYDWPKTWHKTCKQCATPLMSHILSHMCVCVCLHKNARRVGKLEHYLFLFRPAKASSHVGKLLNIIFLFYAMKDDIEFTHYLLHTITNNTSLATIFVIRFSNNFISRPQMQRRQC